MLVPQAVIQGEQEPALGKTHRATGRDLPISTNMGSVYTHLSLPTPTELQGLLPNRSKGHVSNKSLGSQCLVESAPYNRFYGFESITQRCRAHLAPLARWLLPSRTIPMFPLRAPSRGMENTQGTQPQELRLLLQCHDNSRASPGTITMAAGFHST